MSWGIASEWQNHGPTKETPQMSEAAQRYRSQPHACVCMQAIAFAFQLLSVVDLRGGTEVCARKQ